MAKKRVRGERERRAMRIKRQEQNRVKPWPYKRVADKGKVAAPVRDLKDAARAPRELLVAVRVNEAELAVMRAVAEELGRERKPDKRSMGDARGDGSVSRMVRLVVRWEAERLGVVGKVVEAVKMVDEETDG